MKWCLLKKCEFGAEMRVWESVKEHVLHWPMPQGNVPLGSKQFMKCFHLLTFGVEILYCKGGEHEGTDLADLQCELEGWMENINRVNVSLQLNTRT